MDSERRLSRKEFDEVIRRATELAASDSDASEELTESELYRIAGDVGLSERHVRRALIDVRGGPTDPGPATGLERFFGPETVRAARVVPGTRGELIRTLDDFMVAGQLLQRVRKSSRLLQYRPAVDWASQIARAASSTSRRHYVASAKRVEVRFDELPDEEGRVLVEIEVDPGTRSDSVTGAAMGVVFGGGATGTAVGMGVASAAAPLALAITAGVLAGGAIAGVIGFATARSHRRKVGDVRAEVEGILDRLEQGESLEPPPPSWRKWVERQFHGARKLLDDGGGSGADSEDPGGGFGVRRPHDPL